MAVLRGIRFAVDAGLVPAVIESDANYVVDLIKLGVAPSADVPELSCRCVISTKPYQEWLN